MCVCVHAHVLSARPLISINIQAIGRTNASGNWKKTFSEDERLLTDITSVHALGFAMKYFGMEAPDSQPTKHQPPPLEAWEKMLPAVRAAWFETHMRAIVCGGEGEGEHGIWRWRLADFTEEPQPLTAAQAQEQALKDAATCYHCRFCDKRYVRPKSMRDHENKKCPQRPFSYHGENEADQKMLHCTSCRTGYAGAPALQRHERVCFAKNVASSSSSSSTCTPAPWGRVDGINNYALRYVNEGLLSMAFRDLIRFGNGEACVRFYK